MATTKPKARGGWLASLFLIALGPVYLLSKISRRDSKLYLFGSGHGDRFADNSKYLFLYFAKNHPDKQSVFVSKNKQVISDLTRAGYQTVDISTWKGKLTALRAGTCFISHSTHDIHPLLVGGARVVQLWHGTPLKKIAYDSLRPGQTFRSRLKHWLRKVAFTLFPYLNTSMNFDHLVASSEKVVDCFLTGFRIKRDEVAVLGQPRNDSLLANYDFDPQLFPEIRYLKQLTADRKKIITWMPTHRLISGGGMANLIENYGLDQNELAELLTRHNAQLVIKAHPLDQSEIEGHKFLGSEVVIYPYDDPYPLLRSTDILITDYSSVYFDFLLVDRPIIFACFDYETYMTDDASMYFDYDKVTPGPKCSDWVELIRELDEYLRATGNEGVDCFSRARKDCRDAFNAYTEGNCARVANRFVKA